jgi:hypothetical protein
MQKLHPQEFDIPTNHSKVGKFFGISPSRVMFMVHFYQSHGVSHFNYFPPHQDLSNDISSDLNGDHMQKLFPSHYCAPHWYLSNDPNKDHMQNLHPQKVDLPTYQLGVRKIVGVSSSRVIFRVHYGKRNGVGSLLLYSLETPYNGLLSDPKGDCMQQLHP